MNIREAQITDNDSLINLQSQCTTGTDIMVVTVNGPDFFARVKAYEDYKVYTAFEDDVITGSIACAVRNVFVGGKETKAGYIFQMFTSPHHRRKGIGSKLYKSAEDYLIQQKVGLSYFIVMEDNMACMNLYEGMGYRLHCTQIMSCIPVYKKYSTEQHSGYNVRTMKEEDIEKVIELAEKNWGKYDLYEHMTPEKIFEEIKRIPEYGFDNILVLEKEDEIVACLGYWDWSKITRIIVKAVNRKLRLASCFLDCINHFCAAPRISKPGTQLKQVCLTHIAFRKPEYILTLLKYINNIAYDKGIEQICFTCEKENILLHSIEKKFHINIPYNVYVKCFMEEISMSSNHIFIRGIDL